MNPLKTVTVENLGGATMTISATAAAGDFTIDSNTCTKQPGGFSYLQGRVHLDTEREGSRDWNAHSDR